MYRSHIRPSNEGEAAVCRVRGLRPVMFEIIAFRTMSRHVKLFSPPLAPRSADTELYVVLHNRCDLRSKAELNANGCCTVLEIGLAQRILVRLRFGGRPDDAFFVPGVDARLQV